MLHLVFQSPIEPQILARMASGDEVLFMENAVLRLLKNSRLSVELSALAQNCRLYALTDDMAVRGIANDDLLQDIGVVTYEGFVTLTLKNSVIQTWT